MRMKILPSSAVPLLLAATAAYTALVNTTLNDFLLPGSQPNQSGTFTASCECHDGYNAAVEPSFNWKGSMMAQAARDPLFYAAMAIANQDAAFSGDLCIRCHSPVGWLEGRSTPTDGSALIAKDREGVQCEFCHRMVKPSARGVNPYPLDVSYRTVISGYSSTSTYGRDTTYLNTLSPRPTLTGNGMYVVDSDATRRGPRTDADPRHPLFYSPFHRDAAYCGTCHDVSNPAFQKNVDGSGNFYYTLNTLNTPPPSPDPYTQFPVERTYSEWLMSAYNTAQGVYAPQFGGNRQYVSTCQDCHMRDVTGKAAQQGNVATRTDLALHDMTGGNTWIPKTIPTFFPGETSAAALDSGIARARYMLKNAATLQVIEEPPNIRVRVTNETGHKLPSGYPEGRRMWINVKAFDATMNLIAEFGAYDTNTATLTTSNTKVYEVKLGMSPDILAATGLTNESDGSSFHFVLNNMVVKDNRIPPRGFTNQAFKDIQSPPVGYSYSDGQYWDETVYTLPSQAIWYEVSLYYQTASREYITFLRDNNTTDTYGTRLYSAWVATGKSAPVLMRRVVNETPLPVQLASFNGNVVNGNDVLLEWKTLSETNNYGFFVQQRVRGGGAFTDLPNGFVSGHGTTLEAQYYSWTHVRVGSGSYEYRLRQVDLDRTQHFSDPIAIVVGAPTSFKLEQNFPNPFNPTTVIRYQLPVAGHVTLKIYNVLGQEIAMLVDGFQEAGFQAVRFDAGNLSSGIYFYRIQAGQFIQQRKMLFVR
jgi:hypothetical protein